MNTFDEFMALLPLNGFAFPQKGLLNEVLKGNASFADLVNIVGKIHFAINFKRLQNLEKVPRLYLCKS